MDNVLNFGVVAGDTASLGPANQAALEALVNTVIAAGGGTGVTFRPAPTISSPRQRRTSTVLRLTTAEAGLRFLGDGKASRLIWNRNEGSGGDAHFFRFEDGFSQCVLEHLYFVQGILTNPDGAEQHHAFRLAAAVTARSSGNVEHIHFLNCHFGVFKGDAINCSGGSSTRSAILGILLPIARRARSPGPTPTPPVHSGSACSTPFPGTADHRF